MCIVLNIHISFELILRSQNSHVAWDVTAADKTVEDYGFKYSFELALLNNIIGARAEEILANVWNQLQLSGYEDKLFSGVVFTGGGANLKNLEKAFHKVSKIEKVKTAKFVPTTSPKKVHIIGGGIGGMEAARVLKLRGHEPVIHEQTDHLGGTFIAASAESYKGKLRDLLTWYRKQMADLKIEIHYNEKVESIAPFAGAPVIIATGAVPRVLKKVPGHEKMVEACEYLTGTPVGEKVAVIGGGLTGCEIAYELALQGKQPVIVEMKNDLIAQTGVCLANSSYLREWFAWKKVQIIRIMIKYIIVILLKRLLPMRQVKHSRLRR
jgi:NADPH-dependent 2,4-dienoyl-CoA reductase/sulfur reductase-like enzyme